MKVMSIAVFKELIKSLPDPEEQHAKRADRYYMRIPEQTIVQPTKAVMTVHQPQTICFRIVSTINGLEWQPEEDIIIRGV